jgi:uncharacterized protein YecE (DUF72 family)
MYRVDHPEVAHMPAKNAVTRIGISGWTYPPWRGVFYPKGLRQKDELAYAASKFRTIEINGTFYGSQKPDSFLRWRETTPDDFVFSVKAPRFITHIRRLRDVRTPLANFLSTGILRLGPKLGPILWQFPPTLKFDEALFAEFFAMLPSDTEAAAELAKQHDSRSKNPAWAETDKSRKLRHAVEIRHDSFRDEAFIKLLRKDHIALVCADTVEWPRLMDVTSDFIYCRLHGSEKLYASGYSAKALDDWERRIRAWSAGEEPADAERVDGPATPRKSGRDVFVYFDNDIKVKAPENAADLEKRLNLK